MSGDAHSPFVSRAALGVLTARFAVLVDADGRILDVHVTLPSGREPENLIVDCALVEALRRFHFVPALAAGHPQRAWGTVECALRLGPAGTAQAGVRGHDAPVPARHSPCRLSSAARREDRENL
ncbi:MAG: hypothetical protein JF585_00990 [Burkholderiales bacterium]|nr:hypothetical protein [Burkholderiales bacterium]